MNSDARRVGGLALVDGCRVPESPGWRELERREILLGSTKVGSGSQACWTRIFDVLEPHIGLEVRHSANQSQGQVVHSLSLMVCREDMEVSEPSLLLDLVASMLCPGATLGLTSTPCEVGVRRQILPEGVDWRNSCSAAGKSGKIATETSLEFLPPSLWPWNVEGALDVLARCGGGSLVFRLTRIRPSDRPTESFQALDRVLFTARDKGALMTGLERMVEDSAALKAAPILIRVDVFVEGASNHHRFADDFVALALFGCRAGRPGTDNRADLRGIVGIGTTPRPLIYPCERAMEGRLSEQGRDQRGHVEIGCQPGGAAVSIGADSRMRHTFVIGGTGTGKSSLMRRMMMQDISAGDTVVLLDPHGDLALEVGQAMGGKASSGIHFADAGDPMGSYTLDLLAPVRDPHTRERAFDAFMSVFQHVLYDRNRDALGPMFEQYFRNALFLLALGARGQETLADLPRVFTDRAFRAGLQEKAADPDLNVFWSGIATRTSGEQSLENFAPYIVSKLTRMIGSPLAKRLFSRPGGGMDLSQQLQPGNVLLLRLPKGLLGEGTTRLAAAMTIVQLADAIMSRASGERRVVRIYVDEVQACPGNTLSMLLAEGRKFGASLTLASQSLGQLDATRSNSLGSAILANVANLLIFRVGAPDALALAPWLTEPESWRELCQLPDFNLRARIMDAGWPKIVPMVRTSVYGGCTDAPLDPINWAD